MTLTLALLWFMLVPGIDVTAAVVGNVTQEGHSRPSVRLMRHEHVLGRDFMEISTKTESGHGERVPEHHPGKQLEDNSNGVGELEYTYPPAEVPTTNRSERSLLSRRESADEGNSRRRITGKFKVSDADLCIVTGASALKMGHCTGTDAQFTVCKSPTRDAYYIQHPNGGYVSTGSRRRSPAWQASYTGDCRPDKDAAKCQWIFAGSYPNYYLHSLAEDECLSAHGGSVLGNSIKTIKRTSVIAHYQSSGLAGIANCRFEWANTMVMPSLAEVATCT